MAYKRPESVLVVVASRCGQVLVMERAEPRGFWQSVTGSLHEGETATQAARRELREETGFVEGELINCQRSKRFPILPAWRARYAPDVSHNTEYLFHFILPAVTEPALNPAEHVRAAWLPTTQAAGRVSSWTNSDAILDLVCPPQA